jgi:hypothetical protein
MIFGLVVIINKLRLVHYFWVNLHAMGHFNKLSMLVQIKENFTLDQNISLYLNSRRQVLYHIFWVGSACVLVGSDNNEWYMCWLMLYHIFDELAQLILVSWLVWFMRWVVFMFQILHMFILLVHDFKVQQLVLLMIGLFYVNFDERDHASSYWASKSCFMRWVILTNCLCWFR